MTDTITHNKPTPAFIGASWLALTIGVATYLIGVWNAGSIETIEKGFYALGFVLSLFAVVAVQKNVRDLAGFKGLEEYDDSEYETPPNPPL